MSNVTDFGLKRIQHEIHFGQAQRIIKMAIYELESSAKDLEDDRLMLIADSLRPLYQEYRLKWQKFKGAYEQYHQEKGDIK